VDRLAQPDFSSGPPEKAAARYIVAPDPPADYLDGFSPVLTSRQQAVWDSLRKEYPFLDRQKWRPRLFVSDGMVYMFWDGGLEGDFGFVVALQGRLPDSNPMLRNAFATLRASDDIVFVRD